MASARYEGGQRHPAAGSIQGSDPGVTARFRVKIGGETIGQFQECGGLSVEYEVFEWPEGGQNQFVHKLRGRAKFPNVVLKQGVTYEDTLLKWFQSCADKASRKQLTIELLAGDLKPIRTWAFAGAFPVKWSGPNFNAAQGSAAIETLEIVHQGFAPGVS